MAHLNFLLHSVQVKQFLCQTARSALILSIWKTCLLHNLHNWEAAFSASDGAYEKEKKRKKWTQKDQLVMLSWVYLQFNHWNTTLLHLVEFLLHLRRVDGAHVNFLALNFNPLKWDSSRSLNDLNSYTVTLCLRVTDRPASYLFGSAVLFGLLGFLGRRRFLLLLFYAIIFYEDGGSFSAALLLQIAKRN